MSSIMAYNAVPKVKHIIVVHHTGNGYVTLEAVGILSTLTLTV